MNRESDDRRHGEGAGRDTCAANIAVVRRIFAAVETRGDPKDFAARWAAYAAMYDPNVVIHEATSLPYGGDYSGDDAVARHAQGFGETWEGLQSRDDRKLEPQFLADGNHVIVLWRQRAASVGGEVFDMPAISLYQMKDGRVLDSRMFHFDTAAILAFLERARQPAQAEN